ncbi:MAG TPA: hypothetical protein VGQ52_12715 [Gemmatimonadaceae bacterium]|nr:hypothetical protein [Gemmatimonadaceae bacterium]
MTGFISELSDLAVLLAIICVPVATAAVVIPVGKAITERLRQRRPLPLDAESRLMHRLDSLEALTLGIAAEVQKQSEHQHALEVRLRTLSITNASEGDARGRVITPH